MKPVAYLWIAAVPLLLWPVFAAATAMSLASPHDGETTPLIIAARAFQISSLGYPLVSAAGAVGYAVSRRKEKEDMARIFAIAPLLFACFVLLCFIFWMLLDPSTRR